MFNLKYIQVNKDTFNTVVNEHRNLIYKVCCTYCAQPENRKDLQQEILVQLWNAFPKFDGRAKMSTWIYRVAMNTAITFYRKDKKHKAGKVSLDAALFNLPCLTVDPEPDANIEWLYLFIHELNELDKALMLLYLDGNKYSDMAEILGISETNAATKINRIKKVLKEKFTEN